MIKSVFINCIFRGDRIAFGVFAKWGNVRFYYYTRILARWITVLTVALICSCSRGGTSQDTATTDANTPLHLLQPDYPVFYGETTPVSVKATLDRIHGHLSEVTPTALVDKNTKKQIYPV